jgi:CelD/BcsL family acetyltransferase involved in cellulose biosynthesis
MRRASKRAKFAIEWLAPHLMKLHVTSASAQQVNVDGLIVRCRRTLPSDATILADWEQLYRRTPSATPFHSPAWQRALLKTAQAMRRLRLFTVYDGSRLVAVLPLEARSGRVLRTSGALLTDYLDPLIDPAYAQRSWPALLKSVRILAPRRSVILEHIREEACGCGDLRSCADDAGFELADTSSSTVARIRLPGSWDEYLAALDGHERKELRRKLKKAEQQGGATLVVCNDPATVLAEMATTFEMFQNCGGGKGRKARWLFPKHFALSAPALAASGRLVLYKLMIENRYAAGMIALPTHDGQILWNTAFDCTMKQWSPGIVLFGMLIRLGIEQGHQVFDLLRGQYDYKYRLGAADHPLRTLTLRPAA